MALQNSPRHISAVAYLQGELLADIKHQHFAVIASWGGRVNPDPHGL